MKIGTIIKVHGSIGIVLQCDKETALCYWEGGAMDWIFLPNYSAQSLEVIV